MHILGLKMAFSLNINMTFLLTYPAGTLHGLFGSDEMIFHFANDEIKNLYINDICKEKGKMKDERYCCQLYQYIKNGL